MKTKLLRSQFEEIRALEIYSKPVVVAYGLMNSGKSSLLNMLTGHTGEEFFKTNDFRETVENKAFEGEQYVFLDTPGLDANAEDDAQAAAGAEQADIVLFVHQPQGELEANEVAFLRGLAASFGPFASRHVLIVLTKIENEEPGKIDEIERKIRAQCENKLGVTLPIFQVSNKRYQNGVLKVQHPMLVLSRIPALMDYLQGLVDMATEPRTQRINKRIAALTSAVASAEQLLGEEKARLRTEICAGFTTFNQQVEHLHTFLDASASNFKRI